MLGRGLRAVANRAADLVVERNYVPHALLHLRLAQTVTSHGHELVGPQFLQVADFACGHNDGAGHGEGVVLEELVLFETETCEDLAVVLEHLDGVQVGPSLANQTV